MGAIESARRVKELLDAKVEGGAGASLKDILARKHRDDMGSFYAVLEGFINNKNITKKELKLELSKFKEAFPVTLATKPELRNLNSAISKLWEWLENPEQARLEEEQMRAREDEKKRQEEGRQREEERLKKQIEEQEKQKKQELEEYKKVDQQRASVHLERQKFKSEERRASYGYEQQKKKVQNETRKKEERGKQERNVSWADARMQYLNGELSAYCAVPKDKIVVEALVKDLNGKLAQLQGGEKLNDSKDTQQFSDSLKQNFSMVIKAMKIALYRDIMKKMQTIIGNKIDTAEKAKVKLDAIDELLDFIGKPPFAGKIDAGFARYESERSMFSHKVDYSSVRSFMGTTREWFGIGPKSKEVIKNLESLLTTQKEDLLTLYPKLGGSSQHAPEQAK